MKTTEKSRPENSATRPSQPFSRRPASRRTGMAPLKIVGVYDDPSSQALAASLFQKVVRGCASVCKLQPQWWSFNLLEDAAEREAAACAAADAAMIWCAANAGERLPESVRAWAWLWLRHRETDPALVALLRCPPDYAIEQSPSRTYLRWLARESGTMLFAGRYDGDNPSLAAPPRTVSPASGRPSVPLEPGHGHVQWGINE